MKHAITADELARRADVGYGPINAGMLTRWLLREGFATTVNGDQLVATPRAVELGAGLG